MKKVWFPLILLTLLLTLVNAQPQTTIYSFPEGFTIVDTPQTYLKLGESYSYSFFVYNQSTGKTMTNETINCTYFLANQSGQLIFSQNVHFSQYWNVNIPSSNFLTTGTYAYGVSCTDGNLGGAKSSYFEVNRLGKQITVGNSLSSLSFLIIMIVMMVSFGILGSKLLSNEYFWILGIFFLFLSFLFLIYNTWLGYQYHLLLTGLPESSVPEIIFYALMTLITAGILTSLGLLFLHWKKLFKYIKNEIKKPEDNYEDIEDWEVDEWKSGRGKFNGGYFNPPKF
jgi:hypothetical protein